MILDSNIMIEILAPNGDERVKARVADFQVTHDICINEIIFAEISRPFADADALSRILTTLEIDIERLSLDACFRAGQAFQAYRSAGGGRETILPDFLIGAQAAERGWPLVTSDRKGFARYFPELELIDPLESDE